MRFKIKERRKKWERVISFYSFACAKKRKKEKKKTEIKKISKFISR